MTQQILHRHLLALLAILQTKLGQYIDHLGFERETEAGEGEMQGEGGDVLGAGSEGEGSLLNQLPAGERRKRLTLLVTWSASRPPKNRPAGGPIPISIGTTTTAHFWMSHFCMARTTSATKSGVSVLSSIVGGRSMRGDRGVRGEGPGIILPV